MKKEQEKQVTISLKIDASLWENIGVIADKEERSKNATVRKMLKDNVSDYFRKNGLV